MKKIKSKLFLLFAVFGIFFIACEKETTLENYMVSKWQTTYLKMEMPTFEKTDSLSIYEDKFDNNPEIIAQSKYNKDGSFSAWFVTQKGDRTSNSKGTWKVVGDSLFVNFSYNGRRMNVNYHITKTKEGFLGKSKYDWDNDGDFDDLLTMKTKRIKE